MARKKHKENYNLSENVVSAIIDPIFTKGLRNREAIKTMVSTSFSTDDLSRLLELIHMKGKYVPLQKGAYIKAHPRYSHYEGEKYELDVLSDAGLISEDGELYGIIKDDTTYNDSFNPYHHEFKINFLNLSKDGKLEYWEDRIEATELTMINRQDIKFFKAKKKKGV